MSTKNIRRALEFMRGIALTAEQSKARVGALAEVETIEKAAKTIEAESIGDFVYEVRDRAAADASFKGNNWEHPRCVAYGEAAQVISNIAKESK